jgi:hypothetical protein
MDRENGSLAVLDSSLYQRSVTFIGGAALSTANSLFGGRALAFGGCRLGTGSGINYSTNDFTVEAAIFLGSGQANGSSKMIFLKTQSTGYYQFQLAYSGPTQKLVAAGCDDGNNVVFNMSSATTISESVWYRVALRREGSTFSLWVNGVQEATATYAGALRSLDTPIGIGAAEDNLYPWAGYIDEVRFTRLARPVVNQTYAYPNSGPTDPQFSNVALLLRGNGSTIVDLSKNTKTLSTFGAVQTSTAQLKYGSASISNDGVLGYIDVSGDIEINLAGSPYTIEAWVYPNSTSATQIIYSQYPNGVELGIDPGGDVYVQPSGATFITTGIGAVLANVWQHLAVTYDGVTTRLFVNGEVRASSTSISGAGTSNTATIASRASAHNYPFNGFIDDLRVTRFARYVTNYELPPLSFVQAGPTDQFFGNVSFLVNARTLADLSLGAQPITPANGASISTAKSKFGGSSLFLNGSSYFSTPSAVLALGSSDFTIEGWFYANAYPAVNATLIGGFATGSMGFEVLFGSTGRIAARGSATGASDDGIYIANDPTTAALGQWHHFAVVGQGSTKRTYLNGVGGTPVTDTRTYHTSPSVTIGMNGDATWYFDGYLDDIRVTIGTARYLANFTPPDAPHPIN